MLYQLIKLTEQYDMFIHGGADLYRVPRSLDVHQRKSLTMQKQAPNPSARTDGTGQEFQLLRGVRSSFLMFQTYSRPHGTYSWSTVSHNFPRAGHKNKLYSFAFSESCNKGAGCRRRRGKAAISHKLSTSWRQRVRQMFSEASTP
jgi:hypothetical protein